MFDLFRSRLALQHAVARQIHRHVPIRNALIYLNVLGHVDQHGSLATGGGDVKRLLHDPRQFVDVRHQIMVLGDAATDLDHGRFLKRVFANHGGVHLPRDRQQWNAVQLRVGDRSHQIRGSGAAGGHADAHFAGRTGIALRGESPALFVPRQDGTDPACVPREGLVHRHAAAAGVGEDDFHTVIDQRFDQDVGPIHRLCGGSGSRLRHRQSLLESTRTARHGRGTNTSEE